MRFAWSLVTLAVAAVPAVVHAQPGAELSPGEKVLLQSPAKPATPYAADEAAGAKTSTPTGLNASSSFHADDAILPWQDVVPSSDIFRRWQWSASYLTGYIGVNIGPMLDIPFEMLPQLVRINCMWNRPKTDRFMKGTWEGIAELTCMPVTYGPASIVIGGSLMLRYNFGTWKNRRWNPYFQMGGGGMYTDEWLFNSPVLSSGFEFIIQNAIGMNVRLGERWSLNAEWAYYHFSNSGIVMPNVSVNQLGGLVGLTYYFKKKDHR